MRAGRGVASGYTVLATAKPEFKVGINPELTWYIQGANTKENLEHERLHLRISEYILTYAKANAPEFKKQVNGCLSKARGEEDAKNGVRAQMKAYLNRWSFIDFLAQDKYKTETKNNQDEKAQARWEANWKTYVDEILKKEGWKK